MGVLNLKLAELATKRIEVGFVGENLHNQVRIDSTVMFNSYPNAIPSMAITIPTGESYPVFTTREGNDIVWNIQRSALVIDGDGEIQLTFTDGEMVAKTYKCKIRIKKSILPEGETPSIIENWIEQANTALNGIPETINSALNEAKQSGEFNGATFVPEVNDGVLSWSNDAGLENPESVDFSNEFALKDEIPTKVSDLDNDSGFLTQETDPTVPSWAKQPNKPSYTPQEVGALPANTPIPQNISDLNNDSNFYEKPQNGIPLEDLSEDVMQAIRDSSNLAPVASSGDYDDLINKPEIPSKTSDLQNDSNFLTQETDPTVPSWAKQPTKPSYTAQEVGALPNDTVIPNPASIIDDTAGDGDTSKVWSADKAEEEIEKKYEKPQNGIPIEDLDASISNSINQIPFKVDYFKKEVNCDNQIVIQNELADTDIDFEIKIKPKFEKYETIEISKYTSKNFFDLNLMNDLFGVEYRGITLTKVDNKFINIKGTLTQEQGSSDNSLTCTSAPFTLPEGEYAFAISIGGDHDYEFYNDVQIYIQDEDENIVWGDRWGNEFLNAKEGIEYTLTICYSNYEYQDFNCYPYIILTSALDNHYAIEDIENAVKYITPEKITINIPEQCDFYGGTITSKGKIIKEYTLIDSYDGEYLNVGWIAETGEIGTEWGQTPESTGIKVLNYVFNDGSIEVEYDITPINFKVTNPLTIVTSSNFLSAKAKFGTESDNFLKTLAFKENPKFTGSIFLNNNDSVNESFSNVVCLGSYCRVTQNNSFTIGCGNSVLGYDCTVLGLSNEVFAPGNSVLGRYNEVDQNAYGSCVLGYSNDVYGDNNVAIGTYNKTYNYMSFAEGYSCTSKGAYSYTGGSYCYTAQNAYYARATGSQCSASGEYAISCGEQNKAHGKNSVCFGSYNAACSNYSTVFGYENSSVGYCSFVFGKFNKSESEEISNPEEYAEWRPNTQYFVGDKVYVIKQYPYSDYSYTQIALYLTCKEDHISSSPDFVDYDDLYYWNNDLDKYAEIVGNGTYNGNRSNARTLDWNGNEWLAGGLTINGSLCICDSYESTASGLYSIARGYGCIASGDLSFASGSGCTASGYNSFASGAGSTASDRYSIAFGQGCNATGYSSYCFGSGSTAHGDYSIAVGGGVYVGGKYAAAFGQGLDISGTNCFAFGCYNAYNPELNVEEKDPFKGYRIGEIVKETTTDPSSGEEIVKYYHYNQEGYLTSWILIPDGAKKYVEMVGGGDTDNRLNLRTLDWGGNQRLLGTLYVENDHEVVKQLRDPNSEIGENSVAIGYDSIASGTNSVAIGYKTIAAGYNQFVFGQNNAPTENEQIQILNADPWEQNHEYVSGDVVSYTDNGVTQYYMCHNYAPAVLRPRTNLIHNIWVPYTPENGEDMSNVEYWVESGIYSTGNKVKDIAFDGKEYYYLCTVDNPGTTIYPTNYTYWHTLPSQAVVTLPNKFIEIAGNGQNDGWDGDRRNARLLDVFGNEYLGGTLYVGCDSLGKNGVEVVTKENKATSSTLGLVKVGDGAQYGITMLSDGTLRTLGAYNAQIKAGTDAYRPIVPEKQDVAVFYGLSKLAGVDLKNSNTPVGMYPQEAKTAIQNMLGIESDIPLIEEISSSTPSITGMPNVRYNCGTCSLLTITPPAAGSIVVRFHSGSTATVLTVPNTVKFPAWFDYTSLDTDTTYEIVITDGVYGGIMSWAD